MKTVLRHIVSTFLKEEIDYFALSEAIASYKQLLEQITPIDIMETDHRADIQLKKGIAIGLSWAALCLDDMLRTRQFVRGIVAAIEQLRTSKNTPVHLVYAGTGPYATLILPVLSLYNPSELQLSLLEINENSYQNVQHIFKVLGFQGFILRTTCTDATDYVFPDAASIDIIVSETMQHALQKEMQVPITINLVRQVAESTIFIPQQIDLRLAAIRATATGFSMDECRILGNLMAWNADMARTCNPEKFPKRAFLLDKTDLKDYDYLAILTDIQVFGEDSITINQSGLSVPKIVAVIENLPEPIQQLQFQYQLQPSPEMVYHIVSD